MIDANDFDGPFYSWESPYGGDLVFARVCPECGKYVTADDTLKFRESIDGGYEFEENATCKDHGRVLMPFIGDM